MEEKFRAEQEAIQLKLQQEKLQREQEELAHNVIYLGSGLLKGKIVVCFK